MAICRQCFDSTRACDTIPQLLIRRRPNDSALVVRAALDNAVAHNFRSSAAHETDEGRLDSQRDLKLAKQQFVWTLWPEHRQLFPQSRLRKCHFLLIIGTIAVIAVLFTTLLH